MYYLTDLIVININLKQNGNLKLTCLLTGDSNSHGLYICYNMSFDTRNRKMIKNGIKWIWKENWTFESAFSQRMNKFNSFQMLY